LAAKAAAKNLADLMAKNEEMRLKIERNSRRYKEVVGQMKERAAQWAAAAAQAKSRADQEQARLSAVPKTVAGKLGLAWRIGRAVIKKVNLAEQQKEAAERQGLVKRIKKAALEVARKEVGGEVETLRAEAEAAQKREELLRRKAEKMAERMEKMSGDAGNLEDHNRKLIRELGQAEAKIRQVEAEREKIRGMWIEAANARTSQSLARR
jgi:chromosome segregation ATPase